MSADNQVEPVAAMSAAAAAASGSVAGSGGSEYLKRTCLICGCQTNQTINIYEPRSGPNIVQLIQAKFKFQPLNEDKFLCFSCNNWLINWHSLQALNSNDAESQSPSHLGSNSSGGLVQQQQQPQQQQKQSQSLDRARLRPVAQVRPLPQTQVQSPAPVSSTNQLQSQIPPTVISYNKRRFTCGRSASSTCGMRKMLRHCCICGAAIVLRLLSTTPAATLQQLSRRQGRSQCRKCRESEISKWRTLHRRSVAKVVQLQRALRQRKQRLPTLVKAMGVTATPTATATPSPSSTPSPTPTPTPITNTTTTACQLQRFKAPRVDGKVVAMFRRLGTTLSTGEQEAPEQSRNSKARTLRIMSPTKQRPRWTRTLDDDEILLEFDSAISEVLPAATATATSTPASVVRRRLCYQLTNEQQTDAEVAAAAEVQVEVTKLNRKSVSKFNHQTHVNLAGLQLPQGLSISLI